MQPIVLIHGTGVRGDAYRGAYERFNTQVSSLIPGARIMPCYWASNAPTERDWDVAMRPAESLLSNPTELAKSDREQLWAVLFRDPVFELRFIGRNEPNNAAWSRDRSNSSAAVRTRLEGQDSGNLRDALRAAGLSDAFPVSVNTIIESPEFRHARLDADLLRYGPVIARAIVADAVAGSFHPASPSAALTAADCDGLVALVVARLGGTARGAGFDRALRAAVALGVGSAFDRRRTALDQWAARNLGDIAHYLARGGALRELVAEELRQIGEPATIVAHSLGGIIALDLQISRPELGISKLITVGSQGAFLCLADALPSVPAGEGLPRHVQQSNWINVYDSRDNLAYAAEPVWAGRVRDVRLDSGLPFPWAHSAYFRNPAFYELIAREAA